MTYVDYPGDRHREQATVFVYLIERMAEAARIDPPSGFVLPKTAEEARDTPWSVEEIERIADVFVQSANWASLEHSEGDGQTMLVMDPEHARTLTKT